MRKFEELCPILKNVSKMALRTPTVFLSTVNIEKQRLGGSRYGETVTFAASDKSSVFQHRCVSETLARAVGSPSEAAFDAFAKPCTFPPWYTR